MQDYAHHIKRIGGLKILFVMAAKDEYRAELKKLDLHPLITGVGSILAAANVSRALAKLEGTPNEPDLVINIGTAGSRTVPLYHVLQVGSSMDGDTDARSAGFAFGKTPLDEFPPVIDMPVVDLGLRREGNFSSTNFNNAMRKESAELSEMEFHAVLRACMGADKPKPVIGIKAISDNLEHVMDSLETWERALDGTDKAMAGAVTTLIAKLNRGEIDKGALLAMPKPFYYARARRNLPALATALKDLGDVIEDTRLPNDSSTKKSARALGALLEVVAKTGYETLPETVAEAAKQHPGMGAMLQDADKALAQMAQSAPATYPPSLRSEPLKEVIADVGRSLDRAFLSKLASRAMQ